MILIEVDEKYVIAHKGAVDEGVGKILDYHSGSIHTKELIKINFIFYYFLLRTITIELNLLIILFFIRRIICVLKCA